MTVELIAYTPDPEKVIEACGRTCYKSPEKDAEARSKFISGIVRAGHTSVIEHATATFRISDVSRALTHQLVRHRLFSFSQQSQRYVKENEPNYFTPYVLANAITTKVEQDLKKQNVILSEEVKAKNNNLKIANRIYNAFMANAWSTYNTLIELGLKKEDARYVLPNAAMTEICVTGNFREWYNFLKLRCDIHAQHEIRNLAFCILNKLCEIAPSVFLELANEVKNNFLGDKLVENAASLNEECSKHNLTDAEKIAINKKIEDNTPHDIKTIVNDEYEEKFNPHLNLPHVQTTFAYPTVLQSAEYYDKLPKCKETCNKCKKDTDKPVNLIVGDLAEVSDIDTPVDEELAQLINKYNKGPADKYQGGLADNIDLDKTPDEEFKSVLTCNC